MVAFAQRIHSELALLAIPDQPPARSRRRQIYVPAAERPLSVVLDQLDVEAESLNPAERLEEAFRAQDARATLIWQISPFRSA